MVKLKCGALDGARNQRAVYKKPLSAFIEHSLRALYKQPKRALDKPQLKAFHTHSLIAMAMGGSLVGFTSPTYALGVGSAVADSYIGETLSVRVPLFNVESPNSLSVNLTQADGSVAKLSARLDRSNSQLGVVINSQGRVNEPYLSFTLDLNDANNVFSKEFTVLLNLSPDGAESIGAASATGSAANITAQPLSEQKQFSSSGVGSVQGPYEWAESGQVAERFGAVLDGQSLWRVARRINRGLGVSINQMMWSLYQANPGAFASDSVDSLKAGSYLTIPNYQMASRLSDSQAKARLDGIEQGSSLVSSNEIAASEQVAPQEITQSVAAEQPKETQPFQLTAIDKTVTDSGEVVGGADVASQEIISSLAQTVGNLTQELIRKDKQIAYLEEKVEALAEYANVDVDSIGGGLQLESELSSLNADPSVSQVSESDDQPIVDGLTGVDELADIAAPAGSIIADQPDETAALEAPVVETVAKEMQTIDSEVNEARTGSVFERLTLLQWALAGLAACLLFFLLFRRRLAALFGSLNLTGKDDGVEFQPSLYDRAVTTDTSVVDQAGEVRDYSVLSSVKRDMEDDEAIEGVSYLSVNDLGDYEETDIEDLAEDDLEFVSDEDMTFAERFERLIKDKDYDFARELLDFARYNEIDDERYHCERLRLLQAMQDEDGFYEYYYEIEAKIPSFAPNMQTQISQLVVELAQH